MSNVDNTRRYLASNYDADYINQYARDNGLWRAAMTYDDLLDAIANALVQRGYDISRTNGVNNSPVSPRSYTRSGYTGASRSPRASNYGTNSTWGAGSGWKRNSTGRQGVNSYDRNTVGSNAASFPYGGSRYNMASLGAANMGSYGAGLYGTGNTSLGAYNSNRGYRSPTRASNY